MIIYWHVDEDRSKSVKQLLTKAIQKKTLHWPTFTKKKKQ